MLAYIIRRILMLIPVLIGMSVITFSIIHLMPGNPAQTILGEQATPEAIAELEERMGLNEPYIVQIRLLCEEFIERRFGDFS